MEKFCQSCGMPISNNPLPEGIITDFNKKNCTCGYEESQLTKSKKASRENQPFSIEKMKEEGMPRFLEWLSSRGISKL